MTFDAKDHVIVMERKSKKRDAQGHDTWEVTKTEYLPVQWRLFWFRSENQKGRIDSKLLTLDLERGAAVFETYVERDDGGSARMHGSETASDWKDYIEKAQTKSLGRALAAVGYGSQFTGDEFVEGERIVDAPAPAPQQQNSTPLSTTPKGKPTLSVVPPEEKKTEQPTGGEGSSQPPAKQQLESIKNLSNLLNREYQEPRTFNEAKVKLANLAREYNQAKAASAN